MVLAHRINSNILNQHKLAVFVRTKLLYILATRAGVSSNPSRSGSSPTASKISRTAASIRAWRLSISKSNNLQTSVCFGLFMFLNNAYFNIVCYFEQQVNKYLQKINK